MNITHSRSVCVGGGGAPARACCLRTCNLTYPACNARAPYCPRPLWLHHIFRRYLVNGTNFGKKLLNMKYVLWFFMQLSFETLLILRRI